MPLVSTEAADAAAKRFAISNTLIDGAVADGATKQTLASTKRRASRATF